jgi:DNA/RNA endonuclease YhcR with UshA esterase domain
MKKYLLLSVPAIIFSLASFAQTRISAADASKHIGERVTINGRIFSGKAGAANRAQTVLHLGAAYPNQQLTIVISQEDRKNFSYKPEDYLLNKRVTVTGRLVDLDGKPEIIVNDSGDIRTDESSTEPEFKPLDVSGFSRFFEED